MSALAAVAAPVGFACHVVGAVLLGLGLGLWLVDVLSGDDRG